MTEAQERRALITAEKGYLTVTQAMDMLGLKLASIRKICRKGHLSGAEKIGNVWLIPHESVFYYKTKPRKPK
jgi:hypothetical protein